MLNEMIEETMNRSLNTLSIYRHFKGGYYVVQSLASIESTGEEVVIYQSLQDGRVWVRPLTSFRELVPEDKENPTGQKYRFERVTTFNNQLSMVSTENLVKELLSRSDCPIEFLTPQNSNKVWREEYLVGRFEYNYIDENNTAEYFNAFNVYDELERAVLYARANPNLTILKKVYIKQDFD